MRITAVLFAVGCATVPLAPGAGFADTTHVATPAAPAAPDTSCGSLVIRTTPDSASVVLDGAPIGPSPVRVDSLLPGPHKLQIAADGYFTKSATVMVRGGVEQEVALTLARPVAVVVLSEPAGARVWLDGAEAGVAPLALATVKSGQHDLRLELEGHQAVSSTVTIGRAAADTVRVALTPLDNADAARPVTSPSAATPAPRSRRVATIAALVAFVLFAVSIIAVEAAQE